MNSGSACRPAIAQLEERRFVIGNRSLTTLGPVFESRWLDLVLLSQYETLSWRPLVIFGQHHARPTMQKRITTFKYYLRLIYAYFRQSKESPTSHSSAGRAKVCNWKSVFDHLRSRVRITVAGHFYDVTHFFAHSRAPSPAGVSAILGSSRLAESMKPYDCTLRPF